jgi:hypothetical protein
LAIVQSLPERAAILTMFLVGSVEAATNFAVPLYIQIVQGRDAFQTAIAMLPFKLAVFFSNDQLVERLKRTTATPEEVSKALRINEAARLRSLKIAFLALGSLSLLAIFPARRLPAYKPGEVPSEKGQTS